MQSSFTCLQPDELKKFIAGDLSSKRVNAIEDHLSTCLVCRRSLEATVGNQDWWQDLRCALRGEPDNGEDENAESKESVGQRLTALLGPTDDPNMLGRIGMYEIFGLLGYGGMGAVFKAHDPALNRYVAIKILLPHLALSGAARARFRREGQAAAAIIDDCVLPIYVVDQWQGIPYLVMQYTRGDSLQKRIHDRGPLELKEILRIGLQAARGLAAAHAQGLVHRDVKPSNILLDGSVDRALLTDFGLARAVDDASLTASGIIAGTPQYMSPEQARAETVEHRSDLFSLGSVMYAMCAGHAPFRAESSYGVLRLITDKEPRPIREINPDVPAWLCMIISKMMAKQANDRFASAQEVSKLLEDCLAHVQQPISRSLPQSVLQLSQLSDSSSAAKLRAKPWRQFLAAPSLTGKLLAAGIALMLCGGAVGALFLEPSQIQSIEADNERVRIRVLKGEDTIERLTFDTESVLTRFQAGDYTIEIDGADAERQARCEAGGTFLNNARIDQWEKIFSEGLVRMGKIVVVMNDKVKTEAWFEEGYHLFRRYETSASQFVTLWNGEYGATLDVRGNQSQIRGTFLPPPTGTINIHALPFAICSSVNFNNELIPSSLKSGKLRIYDYRVDGSKHILDLEHSEETREGGYIQVVFDEAVDGLLPTEVIFHQGTPYARHFVNTDFSEVVGFNIPLRIAELNTDDRVITKIFPNERLDKKMCRLSHYGLPEPGGLEVTDFGRNNKPWGRRILATVALILAGTIGIWLWRQKGMTP
jgi:serine/threonine protein kinase